MNAIGNDDVVMVRASAATEIVNARVAVRFAPSVTSTVKDAVPVALLPGVPEITPVAGSIESHEGFVPENAHVYGVVPPAAVIVCE